MYCLVVKFQIPSYFRLVAIIVSEILIFKIVTYRRTESDAYRYEPTMQYAQVGSKINIE